MPKNDSMISAPRNRSGSTATVLVRIGRNALRNTWRNSTTVSERPFERAVRT
jgi:hypothetical protein